eukprot:CAMPEP_0204876440 /NCGR_PEP_ID=MMETSP1348-20121228/47636_1 /ASSEMBLY_ACC=CAM_ASM_000700 /TAXON_ID=215587 /ORGANISM="Aplanochytrium stocchinoi, Strain GSBS06" /LENGTH=551 /DNA_ID=CAMNT_0052033197 /DNA_START=243 /DNA_END=1898 /DNA_ORIENTATION=+
MNASNSPSFLFEQIEVAMRRACSRYFRLCCTLNPYDFNEPVQQLASGLASQLPLNLRCFVIDDEEADRDRTACVKELFLHELNTIVPFINSSGERILPWRSTVFLEKDNEDLAMHSVKMVFCFSHVLGDGLSIALFLKTLAEELDYVVKRDTELAKLQECLSLQHPHDWDIKLDQLSPPDFSGLPFLKTGLKNWMALLLMYVYFIWNSLRKFIYGFFIPQFCLLVETKSKFDTNSRLNVDPAEPDMATQSTQSQSHYHIDASKVTCTGYFPEDGSKSSFNTTGTTAACMFSLDQSITQRLRKLSREHNTTLTGLILAAAAVAYKRTYSLPRCKTNVNNIDVVKKGKSDKINLDFFSWGCTANLRGLLIKSKEDMNYGNYSSTGFSINAPVNIPDEFTTPGIWCLAVTMLEESKKMIAIMAYMAGLFNYFSKLSQSNSFLGRRLDRKFNYINAPKIPFLVTNLGNAYLALFKNESKEQKNNSLNKLAVTLDDAYGSLNADSEYNVYQYCITVVTDSNGVLHCGITTNTNFTPQERLETFSEQLKNGLTQIKE